MNKVIAVLALMFAVPALSQSQTVKPVPTKAQQLADIQNEQKALQQQERLYFNMLRDITEFKIYIQTRNGLDELNKRAEALKADIKAQDDETLKNNVNTKK